MFISIQNLQKKPRTKISQKDSLFYLEQGSVSRSSSSTARRFSTYQGPFTRDCFKCIYIISARPRSSTTELQNKDEKNVHPLHQVTTHFRIGPKKLRLMLREHNRKFIIIIRMNCNTHKFSWYYHEIKR